MHARVATVQFQRDKVGEATRIVKDNIVPAVKGHQGFKGQLLLIQPDSGKALSINLWDTDGDMTAFETSTAYAELMGKLVGVIAAPPATERYEVAVEDV